MSAANLTKTSKFPTSINITLPPNFRMGCQKLTETPWTMNKLSYLILLFCYNEDKKYIKVNFVIMKIRNISKLNIMDFGF